MWLGSLAWNELIEIVVSSLSSKYKCKPGVTTFNLNNRKKTLAINLTPSNRLVRRFETKKTRHQLHILFIRICIVYSCIAESALFAWSCFLFVFRWWWWYFDQAGVAVSWAVGAIADITTATNSLPQLLNNDDKDGESLSGQWTWHKLSHFSKCS